MSINERVNAVRKTLNLTMEKFGEKLGVQKSAISKIEHSQCSVSEQMTKSICREFNVDYIWLTTGEGEMFADSDITTTAAIDRILAGSNEFHKDILKTITRLNTEELLALESIIDKFIEVKEEDRRD